jgi:hypothetical protein
MEYVPEYHYVVSRLASELSVSDSGRTVLNPIFFMRAQMQGKPEEFDQVHFANKGLSKMSRAVKQQKHAQLP